LIEDYRRTLVAAGRAADTITQRIGDVVRFAATVPSLADATREDVTEYFAGQGRDWKPEYRKKVATSLRLFFQWAAARDLLSHTPEEGLPRVRVLRAARPPAPEARIRSALSVATLHERAVILLGASMGMRRTEIAKAHPRDRTGMVLTVDGKNGRRRELPLDELTYAALVDLESRQGLDSYYLPGRFGGHIHPCTVYKWVVRLVGEGWATHSLRRRAGREGFAATKDIRAVQEFLGHGSLDTTELYTFTPTPAVVAVTAATSLAASPLPSLPASVAVDDDVAAIFEAVAAVSARARAAGLNVEMTVT
jgi:integrase